MEITFGKSQTRFEYYRSIARTADSTKLNKPRLHGNGMLQLDVLQVGVNKRLHIWHPKLPKQKVNTEIHNHRFGFSSIVLAGELLHTEYAVNEVPDNFVPFIDQNPRNVYVAHEPKVSHGENTILYPTNTYLDVTRTSFVNLRVGESYCFRSRVYHSSSSAYNDAPCATLMTKLYAEPYYPYVLVPYGQQPDNDFDRHAYDEPFLWSIIKETLDDE